MDAVAVMRALLAAYAPLVALVGTKIHAGDVPLDEAPAVGIREISRVEQNTVGRAGEKTLVTARVQVTVYAKSYRDQKAVLNAARLGPGVHNGTVADVQVLSVLREGVGPDLSDPAAGSFEQSRDFKISYREPNA